ncbi:MAG: hypothetical protein QM496_21725 [Verrucomicrobiota bacterium]
MITPKEALDLLQSYYDSNNEADKRLHDCGCFHSSDSNDWYYNNAKLRFSHRDIKLYVSVEMGLENDEISEVSLDFVESVLGGDLKLSKSQQEWFYECLLDSGIDETNDIGYGFERTEIKKSKD